LRRALKKVNPRKSPGPDGIPGRVLRGCADQLAEVFNSIFSLSLYQSAVPTDHHCPDTEETFPSQQIYPKRSMDNAIALTVNTALSHLDKGNKTC